MSATFRELGPAAYEVTVHGKLRKADYDEFNRLVEPSMQAHQKVGIIVHIGDMQGWTPAALWEDIKFDVRHYRDVARLAIVGKDFDRKWLATVAEPFAAAEIRYFLERDIEGARHWVTGDVDPAVSESQVRS